MASLYRCLSKGYIIDTASQRVLMITQIIAIVSTPNEVIRVIENTCILFNTFLGNFPLRKLYYKAKKIACAIKAGNKKKYH